MDIIQKTYLNIIKEHIDFPENIPPAEEMIDALIAKNMTSPAFRASARDWSEDFGKLYHDHETNCAIFMDGCLADIHNNPSLFFKEGQESNEYKIIDEYIIEVGYFTQRLKLQEIDRKEVMRRANRANVSQFVQNIEEQDW